MSKNTGGPAFPHEYKFGDGTANRHDGMTLRDYFAAKAMQALIAAKSSNLSMDQRGWPIGMEIDAWLIADAMLAERDK